MSYKLYRRPNSPNHWIEINAPGQRRLRQSSHTAKKRLAEERAATLEAELLRTAWHGERRGTRSFAEAVLSYLDAEPRNANDEARLRRLMQALGDVTLAEANQEKAIELKAKMLRPGAAPATYLREVVTPLRTIVNYAHKLGWCDPAHIAAPREAQGRTRFFFPSQVECLIASAAPHVRPLLIFLPGTGARMAEALELEWPDVDLIGARAIFWADRTKGGKRRNVQLPPRVVAALANLPHREGPVFRKANGQPYADRGRRGGGQIKKAWAGALKRAGLPAELTRHDLRHTWATWHYALHKDLLRLKEEGGWSSVTQVERYAHLMPAGHEPAIQAFLGGTNSDRSVPPVCQTSANVPLSSAVIRR